MRVWAVLLFTSLGCAAFADRVIDVPIGRSLAMGTFQASFLEATNQNGAHDRYLAFAPITGFEIAIRERARAGESGHGTVDFAYNIVAPVAALSPGISVGMLDSLNETIDGRRTYVAATFRQLLDVGEKGANGEVTMGIQFGHLNSGFVGASIPLADNFRFLAEHNGARISAGFELALAKTVRVRAISQEGTLLFGLNLSRRF